MDIAQGEAIIKMEHVELWYDVGKPMEVHALKDINLEIIKGDYVAFFGPSGCGKTTMLYAIAGIDRFQDGKVYINGRNFAGLSNKDLALFRQTGIGIVFQQFNLVPSLSVVQNVALPMAFLGKDPKEAEVEAQKLVDRLQLTKYSHRYPFELSGGQQQRVGIARALANDPPIIIADEPLGNLDSTNAHNVLEFFKELNEKDGRTIIMVTHEAWSLRDVKTIYYMKDGVLTGVEHQTAKDSAEALLNHLKKEMGGKENEEGSGKEEYLSARVLARFLLRGYSVEETDRFESFLRQRLLSKIKDEEFINEMRKPFKDGGVGLWKGKADRINRYVNKIIETRHDVLELNRIIEQCPEISITDEVINIRNWILEDYTESKLSHTALQALDQAISDRLRGFTSNDDFIAVLERGENDYGVGLSYHSAIWFTEKIESIIGDFIAPSEPKSMLDQEMAEKGASLRKM